MAFSLRRLPLRVAVLAEFRHHLLGQEPHAFALPVPVLAAPVEPGLQQAAERTHRVAKRDQLFAEHHTVKHSVGEYVRGTVHTNTVEGLFSVFKRGMIGVYQHCSEKHLHRYLAEADFRYNHREKLGFDDTARTEILLAGTKGKRLLYAQAN